MSGFLLPPIDSITRICHYVLLELKFLEEEITMRDTLVMAEAVTRAIEEILNFCKKYNAEPPTTQQFVFMALALRERRRYEWTPELKPDSIRGFHRIFFLEKAPVAAVYSYDGKRDEGLTKELNEAIEKTTAYRVW
jgi:hypothetical protein